MGHFISIELDVDAAKSIRKQLEHMPMPPIDEDDHAQYLLRIAIDEALATDDAEDC